MEVMKWCLNQLQNIQAEKEKRGRKKHECVGFKEPESWGKIRREFKEKGEFYSADVANYIGCQVATTTKILKVMLEAGEVEVCFSKYNRSSLVRRFRFI